jgi:hypothetical protein
MSLTPVAIERAIEFAIGDRPASERTGLFSELRRGRVVIGPGPGYVDASIGGVHIVRIPDQG